MAATSHGTVAARVQPTGRPEGRRRLHRGHVADRTRRPRGRTGVCSIEEEPHDLPLACPAQRSPSVPRVWRKGAGPPTGAVVTFAVMWSHGDVILGAADTLTSGGTAKSRMTSLGQESPPGGPHVQEDAVKLRSVGKDAIVALAGDVDHALGFLDALSDAVRAGAPIHDAITIARNSVGAGAGEALIGYLGPARPCLVHWLGRKCSTSRTSDPTWIGSMEAEGAGAVAGMVAELRTDASTPVDVALAVVTSYLNSVSVRNDLLRFGVGGVFVGAKFGVDGFHWQRPISYHLYSVDFGKGAVIAEPGATPAAPVAEREDVALVIPRIAHGCLIVHSTRTGTTATLYDRAYADRTDEEMRELLQPAVNALATCDNEFFAFVSVNAPVVVLIAAPRLRNRNEWLTVQSHPTEPGALLFGYPPEFRDILLACEAAAFEHPYGCHFKLIDGDAARS